MTAEQTAPAPTGSAPTTSGTTASGGTASGATAPRKDHRWITLAVIALAQLMVVLDATIVNIALPSAQQDLGFGTDQRQWVVTAYSLAFGSLLLLGGRLGDLFGRKNTFIIGLVGFALASVLGGLALALVLAWTLVAVVVGLGAAVVAVLRARALHGGQSHVARPTS